MAESERIELILTAQNQISSKLDEVVASMNKVKKEGNTMGSSLGDTVKQLGLNFGKYLGPAAIVAGLTACVKEGMESEKVINNLKSAVDTLGGSWEKLGKPMQDYANKLSETTLYTDEEALDVMQRLVTVTGDAENAWKNTGIVLDIASTGMINAEGAAKAVAMAMNGNTAALGKFIPELKGSNAAMLNGKTNAEKAAYAMDLLNDKFGGRAQAQLNTTSGIWHNLGKNLMEIGEDIGKGLLPWLNALGVALGFIIGLLAKIIPLWKDFWKNMAGGEAKVAADNANAYADALEAMNNAQKAGIKPTKAMKDELEKARIAFEGATTKADDFGKIVTGSMEKSAKDTEKAMKMIAKTVKAEYDGMLKTVVLTDGLMSGSNKTYYDGQLALLTKASTDMRLDADARASYHKSILEIMTAKEIETALAAQTGWSIAYTQMRAEQFSWFDAFNTMNEGLKSAFSATISSWMSGATTFNGFLTGMFNDILGVWEKMLADMVAKYIASGIMSFITDLAGIGGGTAVAGAVTGAVATGAGSAVGAAGVGAAGAGAAGGGLGGAMAAVGSVLLPVAIAAGIFSFLSGSSRPFTEEEKSRLADAKKKYPASKFTGVEMLQIALGVPPELFAFNPFRDMGVVPSFETGGIMPYTGMAYLHKGETITPADKTQGNINIEAGAFVINGVNFTNEGQKKSVAKEIASYIFDYQNNTRPAYRRAI